MLETFVASPLIGGSSSIVTRLLQRYFPTPLEKAQHENILQSMKIAREEIAAREARAEKDLEVRRELLLTQIDASAKQDENRNEMQRWPLGPTAAAIVRASQKRKGSALNVIVVPNSRILKDEDPQKLGACWSAFNVAVDRMQDTAAKYFGEDVLFYWENIRPQNARPPLRGQELVSTVYALTSTEPTALIQVALLNGRTLQLSWSTWGWVGDEGEPDSGNVQIEINPDEPALDKVFERAQTALICALSDRFQLLRCIQSAREPKFVSVNAFVSNVAMTIYNGNTDEYDVASASESLVESYITSLDKIAQNAPYLAADFAASAALRLNMKSDPKAADRLLQCALNYYRAGLPEQESEKEVIGSLMERFFDGPSPQKIQLALRDVRHLSYSDYISKGKIDEVDEIIFNLGYFDSPLSAEKKEQVRAKLISILSYQPIVAIMGKTGAGKSSLANALFGKDTFKVGHTKGTTRKAQQHKMNIGRERGISILDMPGVGEDRKRDSEYKVLYSEWLPKVDVLLWAIQADDRALAIDESFFNDIVKKHLHDGLALIIVVTKSDLAHPPRQWNVDECTPGPDQQSILDEKVAVLADIFKIQVDSVIAVSAIEKFNLQELTHRMIMALPNEKRLSLVRTVESENKTVKVYESVARSVDKEVTDTIGDAWRRGYSLGPIIGGFGIGGLTTGAVSVAVHLWKKVFG